MLANSSGRSPFDRTTFVHLRILLPILGSMSRTATGLTQDEARQLVAPAGIFRDEADTCPIAQPDLSRLSLKQSTVDQWRLKEAVAGCERYHLALATEPRQTARAVALSVCNGSRVGEQ